VAEIYYFCDQKTIYLIFFFRLLHDLISPALLIPNLNRNFVSICTEFDGVLNKLVQNIFVDSEVSANLVNITDFVQNLKF
jgi:hypothetical protein